MMSFRKKKFTEFFLTLCLGLLLVTACTSSSSLSSNSSKSSSQPAWQEQVTELNEKIALLKRWQNGYRATAEQAQFKGDRLQFENNFLVDAKRFWKIAENANQKAQDLEVIIAKLEDQRNKILKRHNQPIPKN